MCHQAVHCMFEIRYVPPSMLLIRYNKCCGIGPAASLLYSISVQAVSDGHRNVQFFAPHTGMHPQYACPNDAWYIHLYTTWTTSSSHNDVQLNHVPTYPQTHSTHLRSCIVRGTPPKVGHMRDSRIQSDSKAKVRYLGQQGASRLGLSGSGRGGCGGFCGRCARCDSARCDSSSC